MSFASINRNSTSPTREREKRCNSEQMVLILVGSPHKLNRFDSRLSDRHRYDEPLPF